MSGEGPRRPRYYSDDFKRRVVCAVNERTGTITDIAREHDVTTGMLSRWRHDPRFNDRQAGQTFLPVAVEPEKAGLTPKPLALPLEAPIEIELSCGSRVRCWGAVCEDALYRVISVLRRAV